MIDIDRLTPELAERVEALLVAWRRSGRAPNGAAQDFARLARENGVGLVDPDRQRALIDETVYAGALFRARVAEARAQAAEAALAGGGWPAIEEAR